MRHQRVKCKVPMGTGAVLRFNPLSERIFQSAHGHQAISARHFGSQYLRQISIGMFDRIRIAQDTVQHLGKMHRLQL